MLKFKNVYVVGHGAFLPGDPVDNDHIDDYIQPINAKSERIKKRILRENKIQTRHYGIDKEGNTRFSLREMAAHSSREALGAAGISVDDLDLICTGTTGGDQAIPGFANMLQAELKAPPLETSSHTGICMSGVVAFKHAAHAIEVGASNSALVTATEFPSRMFKKSRFQVADYNVDFDSHFLRWMLSDASGSMVLSNRPVSSDYALKLEFVHTKSFSGDFPLCMQIGSPNGDDKTSYLDYPSLAEAEKAGAFLLRQDIRLLPHIFDVGHQEYCKLVHDGHVRIPEIDHFLCHYSSGKFAPLIQDLMERADILIPLEKWYSNLEYQGNTGSASIFVMLDDFLKKKKPKVGEKIFCLIPESGRFSVSYMMFEVVEPEKVELQESDLPESPAVDLEASTETEAWVLRELTGVWHSYRSDAWRSKFVQTIKEGKFTADSYKNWAANWIPQVRQGAHWMREAISNLSDVYAELREIIEEHATEEQNDWKILFNDYRSAGGEVEDPELLVRNMGGEALNAFMYHRACQRDAVDLLGAIFIIEGTGQKIIPALLPSIKRQTGLGPECFNFLKYHSENDENHLMRWLFAVRFVLEKAGDRREAVAKSIVDTARATAELYLMQLKVLDV